MVNTDDVCLCVRTYPNPLKLVGKRSMKKKKKKKTSPSSYRCPSLYVCVSVDHIWSILKIPYKFEDECGAEECVCQWRPLPSRAITSLYTLDPIDSRSIELRDAKGLSDVWVEGGKGGGYTPIFFLLPLILGSFWMWIYLYARLSFHFTPIENWIVVFSAFSVAACPSDVLFILCVWNFFRITHTLFLYFAFRLLVFVRSASRCVYFDLLFFLLSFATHTILPLVYV